MKKWTLLLMLTFGGSFLVVNAQNAITLNGSKSEFRVLESTEGSLKVSISIAEIKRRAVSSPRGQFMELFVDGFSKAYNNGKPELPSLTKMIEIPYGAEAEISILSYDEQTVSLASEGLVTKIIPCQPSVSKSDDPTQLPFYYDEVLYATDAFNEDPLVSVTAAGIMRGVSMGHLNIAPIRYNPVQNVLKIYNNIVFEIIFKNADQALTEQQKSKYYSPAFGAAYSSMINFREPMAKDVITKYPLKYVIIGLTSFQSTLQPFVTWKRQKGFNVIEKYYATAPTAATVQTYLQGLYTAGTVADPAPSFVLFVGDVAQIPTNASLTSTHKTDLYFCTFDGASDYLPDMYYGRFSATSVAQLQPQVDKTLEYEKYLMPEPSYLDSVVMIAGVDDGSLPDGGFSQVHGNGQINYGTTNYFNTAHGIYSNTYLWPTTNNAATDVLIRNNCNKGMGYVNYTAHGSSTGWADPSFQTSNIASMSNVHKYGLMVGNCCLTNTFNDTECFGEALLRAANKGAIGYIGASNNSYWDEDYYFGVGNRTAIVEFPTYDANNLGAYDKMFHDQGIPKTTWYYTNAQMIYAGNLAVEASTSSRKKYYWEIYHLMGDPSVMTYFSVPDALVVDYVDPQSIGVTSLVVQTEEDALVAISHNGILLDAELAPVGGLVTLNFTAFTLVDTADIVVTKQNKKPYIGTVRFLAPSLARDASISGIASPETTYNCAGVSVAPTVTLMNMGQDPLIAVNINYQVDAQAPAVYAWAGNLASLASVDVTLPSFILTAGNHTFTAYTSNPNSSTDLNTANDSYSKNYVVNDLVISADFSASGNSFCTAPASVTFTNTSLNGQTYLWDFGDGTTSTDQSPVHNYNALGTYTIELTTSAGVCGTDAETKTAYISVGAELPVVSGSSRCGAGSLTLSATGTGTLNWYDALTGGNLVGTGGLFSTPSLSSTTTYYVQNIESTPDVSAGKTDNSGGGSNLANQNQYEIFDCYTPCTLVSVKVYASTTGDRTFELRDNNGYQLAEATVNITSNSGAFTVPLNFALPVGTNLQLGLKYNSTCNLYRNNANVTYPYTTPGYVSITTSSASTTPEIYYYYVYDWQIQVPACTSAMAAATAIISSQAVAGFGFTNMGLDVTFNNTSVDGISYFWDFGDGTSSTLESPAHTYSSGSAYNVMLVTTNDCDSDTVYHTVDLTLVGMNAFGNDGYFNIYPNPANGAFTLDLGANTASKVQVSDLTGRIISVYEQVSGKVRIDLSAAGYGVFVCRVYTADKEYICKIANIR